MLSSRERANLPLARAQVLFQKFQTEKNARDTSKPNHLESVQSKKRNETIANSAYFNPLRSHYEEKNDLV